MEVILMVLPENIPGCYHAQEGSIRATTTTRAGSSMRLVRLKPQDPGPIGAQTARYNENLQSTTTLGPEISREKICGLLKFLPIGPHF